MRFSIGDRVYYVGPNGIEKNYGTIISAGFLDHMAKTWPQHFGNQNQTDSNQIAYLVRWDSDDHMVTGVYDLDSCLYAEK